MKKLLGITLFIILMLFTVIMSYFTITSLINNRTKHYKSDSKDYMVAVAPNDYYLYDILDYFEDFIINEDGVTVSFTLNNANKILEMRDVNDDKVVIYHQNNFYYFIIYNK